MGGGDILKHYWWEPVLLGELGLEQPSSKANNVGMVLRLVPWLVGNITTILLHLEVISIECGIEATWADNDNTTHVNIISVVVIVIFNGLVLFKAVSR